MQLIATVALGVAASGAVAYGALAAGLFAGNPEAGVRAAPARASALPVEALAVETVDGYERRRTFAGEVRARRTSALAFERAARIADLAVAEGQRVAAGELLAALDVRDLEARRDAIAARRDAAAAQLAELRAGARVERVAAARARVAEQESRVELATIVATRRRELVASQAIAAEELDAARLDAAALRASLAAAREELGELEAGTRVEQVTAQEARVAELDAELAVVDVQLERSRLRAPFDGVVAQVHAEVGSVPAPASPVVALVETEAPEAWIGLPPERAAALVAGAAAAVEVGGRTLAAEFVACLPALDPATRTRTAIFRFADLELGAVVPGEVARLVASERVDSPGLWLSAEGLVHSRRGLWAAYVLEPLDAGDDGGLSGATHRLARRELESLATDGARVLVRGDLAPGELVLASGAQRVTAGQAVRLAGRVGVAQ